MSYIKKEELINHIKNMPWKITPAAEISKIIFLSTVEDFPTADVVEVVRCKDCKHFGKDLGYGKHDCKKYEMPYCLETDYCSYGERSENGT